MFWIGLFVLPLVSASAVELTAVVLLTPHNATDKEVNGQLTISQSSDNGPVTVSGWIHGLTPGLHGLHVHEKGDLSEGCKSTGAHFNPDNHTHGAPEDSVRHVGDLGNVEANEDGTAQVMITDNVISLSGRNSILGRAFVVHSGEDDLGKGNSSLSSTTGNAGDRWACGIVGIRSPVGRWPNSGMLSSPSFTTILVVFSIILYRQFEY